MTVERTDHPDVESLDAYADGERNNLSVDRHVRDCSDCAEAVQALRRVRDDLARLTTVTMPDDVAGRIRAALAADHEQSRHQQRAPADTSRRRRGVGGGSGGGGGRRPHHLGSPREWLVAAACLAVVVAIGVVAVDSRSTTTTANLSAPVSSGTGAEAALDGSALDGSTVAGDRAGASSDEALAAAELAAPEAPPSPVPSQASPSQAAAAVQTTVSASNEVLMDSEFTEHASEVVTVATTMRTTVVLASGTFGFSGAADISDEAWGTLTSPAAAKCYHGLVATSGGDVLAVDQVRYSGVPSLFVVMSVPSSSASVAVAVVKASCALDGDASSPLAVVTVARS